MGMETTTSKDIANKVHPRARRALSALRTLVKSLTERDGTTMSPELIEVAGMAARLSRMSILDDEPRGICTTENANPED